jgi:hypothetical protein
LLPKLFVFAEAVFLKMPPKYGKASLVISI